MTDKELFEKTQKHFNITKKSIVVEVFNKGIFNKILNEIRGPKASTLPAAPAASGGFLSRIAAAIPGTRGHRMRSAEARKQEAEAKSAEVGARFAQQQQMKGIQPPSTAVTSTSGRSTSKTTSNDNLSKRDNILNNIKSGDTIALTLAKDQDNVARIVKIISVSDGKITVNDTRKKSSSNYTINKGNIKDIDYFRK